MFPPALLCFLLPLCPLLASRRAIFRVFPDRVESVFTGQTHPIISDRLSYTYFSFFGFGNPRLYWAREGIISDRLPFCVMRDGHSADEGYRLPRAFDMDDHLLRAAVLGS